MKAHLFHPDTIYNVEQKRFNLLRKLIPFEIILGIALSVIYFYIFGWHKLLDILLGWAIGMTFVASIVTGIITKKKK